MRHQQFFFISVFGREQCSEHHDTCETMRDIGSVRRLYDIRKRGSGMTVYMEVTMDELELPLAIADSLKELAAMKKMPQNSISSIMCHARANGHRCRYIKVEIEDDEDEG